MFFSLNRSSKNPLTPSPPSRCYLLPSQLKEQENKINTNRHKQTDKQTNRVKTKRPSKQKSNCYCCCPHSSSSFSFFLCVYIYFHSHLLRRQQLQCQQNIVLYPAARCLGKLTEPQVNPDPDILPSQGAWFLMKYDFVRQASASSKGHQSQQQTEYCAYATLNSKIFTQLIITNDCAANWMTEGVKRI